MASYITYLIKILICLIILGIYGEVKVIPEELKNTGVIDEKDLILEGNDNDFSNEGDAEANEKLDPIVLEYVQKSTSDSLISTTENLVDKSKDLDMSNSAFNLSDSTERLAKIFSLTEQTNTSYQGMENEYITTTYMIPTACVNETNQSLPPIGITNLSEIPAKEVIIVVLMLSLWIYAIHMTRRAWQRLLKE